ncbi:MAG: TRAP transporter substrate-binding protein [Eubacterium sp.]|nr:TRAP transporter substrate-binding protein [Eubacterium sp.]
MKRKSIMAFLTVGTVLALTGCGVKAPEKPTETTTAATTAAETVTSEDTATDDSAKAEAEPTGSEITLVMAEVNPPDTIVGMTDTKFKEEVESRSNGAIKIDLQASGVLGAEKDVLDNMMGGGGTVDISRISAFSLTPYGAEKSMLLSLPYTFVSRDHYWNFATSDLANEFLNEPVEHNLGVRGIFYGEEGFRHFFTKDEITDISSFNGMKLRVSEDPIMEGLAKGLGASPTVIPFTDLYSSLQTGVVDGAEQPIANYKSNAFPEVAPYMILDGHTIGATEIIITDEAWNELSEEQQQIIIEAGKAAQAYNREISAQKENEVLEQLKSDGVNIIEVSDLTPWQEAVKPVIDENIKGQEDLYKKIVDMQ